MEKNYPKPENTKTNTYIDEVDESESTQPNLDSTEENEIAGYNPDAPLQLDKQYQIVQDHEQPKPKPASERGTLRAGMVLLITGGLMLLALGIWFIIQPKSVKQVAEEPTPEPTPLIPEEKPDFRAKLALQDQQRKNQSEVSPSTERPEPKEPKEPEVKQITPKPPPSRTAQISYPSPPPPTVARQAPRPVIATPSTPPPVSTPPLLSEVEEVEEVDPFEQWNQLAALGQTRGKADIAQTQAETTNTDNPADNPKPAPQEIALVNIGYENDSPNGLSRGTRGILNRTRVIQTTDTKQEIAFGTSAPGVVSVPLIWDEGSGEQLYNRFAVTLTADVPATDGSAALPAGTVLIAETHIVGEGNRLVQASAIALVYPNRQGEIQQETTPPGTILIQGESGGPLIAQGYFDPGPDIAKQDLLVSLLSGIGRVGEVFTEPEQTSTFFSSTFGDSSSSTVVQSREPQIWSAVLDGFFTPLAERMANRSDQQIEQLLSRPNIAVVTTGSPVSITVNGFVNIRR
ncbi:MAG: hypothetical protein F6K36_22600 [Symploca sp. SIO3C6]|nr:hypothetical protein [Symploca sp. SIO3C6]